MTHLVLVQDLLKHDCATSCEKGCFLSLYFSPWKPKSQSVSKQKAFYQPWATSMDKSYANFFFLNWPEQCRSLDYRPLSDSDSRRTTRHGRRRKKNSYFPETSPAMLSIQITETLWIMSGLFQVTTPVTATIQLCLQFLMLLQLS